MPWSGHQGDWVLRRREIAEGTPVPGQGLESEWDESFGIGSREGRSNHRRWRSKTTSVTTSVVYAADAGARKITTEIHPAGYRDTGWAAANG